MAWTMDQIEARARELCREDQIDPDEMTMHRTGLMPRWRWLHGRAVVSLETSQTQRAPE